MVKFYFLSFLILNALITLAVQATEKEETNYGSDSRLREAPLSLRTGLDWHDRPESTKQAVDLAFNNLSKHSTSDWRMFNGNETYNLCGVVDKEIVKKILSDTSSENKDIYFMDIGAGLFQWGEAMADIVNQQDGLSEDLTVHIFSLRGEGGSYEPKTIGRCILHNLTSCKIEELSEQLSKYNVENKFDLIMSHWCFRHLADPLGTFVQAYNFLRPSTGLLFMDGFLFNSSRYNDVRPITENSDPNAKMLIVLHETKAPFLIRRWDVCRSLNQFVLRRPDDNPCQLPFSYIETIPIDGRCQVESRSITRFVDEGFASRDITQLKSMYQSMLNKYCMKTVYGNKGLYSFLSRNNLFMEGVTYGSSNT